MKILRTIILGTVLAFGTVSVVGIQGCTGTQAAYRAAEHQPDKVAYVIAEQYASVLHEAAILAGLPSTPKAAVDAMRRADIAARPFVDKLRPLADAYVAAKNAKTEAELQAAIDNAVLLIADMVRAVKEARVDGVRGAREVN